MSFDFLSTEIKNRIKVIMIGDSGVGKTSLMFRYVDNMFSPTFITTIGIDFKSKILDVEDKKIKMTIWDSSGQERFRSITTSYIRGSDGIVLVYDVTDVNSFENINYWVNQISKLSDNIPMIIVGNKADREDKKITTDMGLELAKKYDCKFYEVSAKNNTCVEDMFLTFATYIIINQKTEIKTISLDEPVIVSKCNC